ncbi:MAG: hypothetical protein VKK63_10650, partial [Synechococcus sp.]|nr:hypothetical protein [Synechococcus sp.]
MTIEGCDRQKQRLNQRSQISTRGGMPARMASSIDAIAPGSFAAEGTSSNQPNNKKATPGGGFYWNESFTWHRAIFSGGCPPNIVAAAAF